MKAFKSFVLALLVFGASIAASNRHKDCDIQTFKPDSPLYFAQQIFWDNRTNSILFADSGAPNGEPSVFRFDYDSKKFFGASIENATVSDPISFAVPAASGADTLIAGQVDCVISLKWDGKSSKAKQTDVIACRDSKDSGAIDRGTTSPDGKLYMSILPSTYCKPNSKYPSAAISRLSVEDPSIFDVMLPGTYSNGLIFDPKSEKRYFADDCSASIFEAKFRCETLERTREVFQFPRDTIETHYPSGLAIDKCSNIYVGDHNSGHISYVDPRTGQVIKTFTVPGTHVTDVAIVGPELNYLAVFTGISYHNGQGCGAPMSNNPGDGKLHLIPISHKCTGSDYKGYSGTPVADL